MRPIDADALFENLDGMMAVSPTGYIHGDTIADMISDAPTIDAVPVIRCRDCKHYYVLNEVRGNCSEYNFIEKIPIDFCSWAERKEE